MVRRIVSRIIFRHVEFSVLTDTPREIAGVQWTLQIWNLREVSSVDKYLEVIKHNCILKPQGKWDHLRAESSVGREEKPELLHTPIFREQAEGEELEMGTAELQWGRQKSGELGSRGQEEEEGNCGVCQSCWEEKRRTKK